jgi:hypothetical protein
MQTSTTALRSCCCQPSAAAAAREARSNRARTPSSDVQSLPRQLQPPCLATCLSGQRLPALSLEMLRCNPSQTRHEAMPGPHPCRCRRVKSRLPRSERVCSCTTAGGKPQHSTPLSSKDAPHCPQWPAAISASRLLPLKHASSNVCP